MRREQICIWDQRARNQRTTPVQVHKRVQFAIVIFELKIVAFACFKICRTTGFGAAATIPFVDEKLIVKVEAHAFVGFRRESKLAGGRRFELRFPPDAEMVRADKGRR